MQTNQSETGDRREFQDLMTVPEVAEFLRTSEQAIRDMIYRGRLAGVVRLGRRVLVRRVDLLASVGL